MIPSQILIYSDFFSAQIPSMKKGKGYVNLQNKLPAYMLEGLKVGINLLF